MTDATEFWPPMFAKVDAGPAVVTDEGRPVAGLVFLKNTDLETVALEEEVQD